DKQVWPAFAPEQDRTWVKNSSGDIWLLEDNHVVAHQILQEAASAPAIAAGSNGAMFTGGRYPDRTYGVFKYEIDGVSPTITEQPAPGVAENAAAVTFTAVASGDPTPTVQWQSKLPGAGQFV